MKGLDPLHVHEAMVLINGQATLKRFRGELARDEPRHEHKSTAILEPNFVDLMKLDIQGRERPVLQGAGHLIKAGRVGVIFLELDRAKNRGATCDATESIRLLEQGGYRFSTPGTRLPWEKACDWLWTLSDVVAYSKIFMFQLP